MGIQRDIKELQGAAQQHGQLLRNLLKEKGDQEIKLECYRTAGSGAVQEAKAAHAWITGRDEELTSLRNSLQVGAQENGRLKKDLEARDKELVEVKTKLGFAAGMRGGKPLSILDEATKLAFGVPGPDDPPPPPNIGP